MSNTTFADVLRSLKKNHPVRKAHEAWASEFNDVTGGSPFFMPTDDAEQMRRLLLVTTRLRSAIEESEIANLPVVKSYCGLLEADTELIKAVQ